MSVLELEYEPLCNATQILYDFVSLRLPFDSYTCEQMCDLPSYRCGQCLEGGIIARCTEFSQPVEDMPSIAESQNNDLSTADILAISGLSVSGVLFLLSCVYYWNKKIRKAEPVGYSALTPGKLLGM